MEKQTLGLIEVRGYLGAVQAADAALKAANVTLIRCEIIKGGLVTVQLTGDVGAIQAAVEAGEEAAKQLGVLITSHAIARLDDEVYKMIKDKPTSYIEEQMQEGIDIHQTIEEVQENESIQVPNASEIVVVDEEKIPSFQQMKLVELRKLAYKLNITSIPKSEIKYAKKEQLIEAIQQCNREMDK
ncbi:BMC domain-containing protein [Bacillus cereus]|uniref:BMC domain-containing protein n=1 Tax=Bacillus cereus TaxID=1396 RepID=UPI000BF75EC6|nr:BMC domain-containing protein [Bacillus cereus]PEX93243.1 ethanolamine utilization protein [Bacillus cereus]